MVTVAEVAVWSEKSGGIRCIFSPSYLRGAAGFFGDLAAKGSRASGSRWKGKVSVPGSRGHEIDAVS